MKTLGLLRNLLSTRHHIDTIMNDYSSQVMQVSIFVNKYLYVVFKALVFICIFSGCYHSFRRWVSCRSQRASSLYFR